MPAEDRDRQFENALARQLRADAAGDSACLDPELLAAYHQRMLSPEEMIVAKEHVVSCGRCQEILAQLEATDHVLAPRNVEANFVVARTSSQLQSGQVLVWPNGRSELQNVQNSVSSVFSDFFGSWVFIRSSQFL